MNKNSRQPYMQVGAESLTTNVYKTGDELVGYDYRFNISRLSRRTGRVNQWFTPHDLVALVKLTQVLASELADDGCVSQTHCSRFHTLAAALDDAIAEVSHATNQAPIRENS